ncbi:hypothetical protein MTR67_014432 [Solanum verrucosum]|uniref:Tryptophan synthase beta chain-like PALP domain-containing protein n=1 Tax=Solanum verrucosum TaxID=315347 RepID=A0AAF0QDV7_SOLVR|nr:hypothetical protein MTR67_014432 [Solanum verrucosum]
MEDSGSPFQFLTKKPYEPPSWASHHYPIPSHTFSLGHFPTPIHKWNVPNLLKKTEVWVKRDDLSGMQLSGNEVRKLEFLLADAVAQGADCIVTIGVLQSNHCRATAVAAKYLNLDCYLILLTKDVHAFSVCDHPDYFYEHIQGLHDGINAGVSSRDIVNIENARGLGYAMNTIDELTFVKQVAETTGVILDPVYSGKAAYGMIEDMGENPRKWEGRKVLFIHTSGLLGVYDKAEKIASFLAKWRKMKIHESVPRQQGIGKMV